MSDLEATIVVPCRHEADNVALLLEGLVRAVSARRCEVLFVDDSDDDATVEAIRAAAGRLNEGDIELAVYRRAGYQRRGGRDGAVIDGLRLASADRIVVMDAGPRHPPELVPTLLDGLGHADLVLASRTGRVGAGRAMARLAFPFRLSGVTDPMTGFFALHKGPINVERLYPRGATLMLEILARHPNLRRADVPLPPVRRPTAGDGRRLLGLPRLRLSTYPAAPRDFIAGAVMIGGVGAAMLEGLVRLGADPLLASGGQLVATLALSLAYMCLWTWRDHPQTGIGRLIGWFLGVRGCTQFLSWLLFMGLTAQLGLHHQLANLACVALASAVNYAVVDRAMLSGATHATGGAPRRRAGLLVAVSAAALAGLGLVTLDVSASTVLVACLLAVAMFNTVVGTLEVRWRLYGWRTPEAIEQMRWPAPGTAAERFSLILPALDEAKVIGATLRRLLRSDYPHLEVIVSLCEGDHDTIAEVDRVIREHHPPGRVRKVVRAYDVPNKPRQLNAALDECSGTVVGVIDAEDDVAPGLLARVDALFTRTGADVVQGGVQVMTLGHRPGDWFKVHNVLEYFFWFTSRVFYQVMCGFVPLAGNTVFIRRDLMIRAGGWPDNLAEDCALGVLLCTRYGAKVVAAYEPELVTREEVPQTIHSRARGSLFWQRVRWNQGFLSVLLQGDWRRLPTARQRLLAGYILVTPFLQASCGLLLPLTVVTVFSLKVPVAVAMLMYAPFLPVFITVVAHVIALGEFSRSYGQKATPRHYAYLILGAPFYQWLLMGAALWAVVRHAQGDTTWHKTEHSGHHRESGSVDLAPILGSA